MDWLDIDEIAEALDDEHPEADPAAVRFTQLRDWILELEDFEGSREDINERKLEAVQAAWIELREEADDEEE